MSGAPLVLVEGLSKRYPARLGWLGGGAAEVRAVEQVSLAIDRGGALGLVGESGCGKSTLLRAILRLVEPSAGRVVVGGVEVTQLGAAALRRFRRRAQIVFQDSLGALDPRLSARDAIAEPLRLHAVVAPASIDGEVERLLALVGLSQALAGRRPHELSGGQRQRVAIARALSLAPELLLLDEPLAALDASLRAQLLALLSELRSERGLTLLFVSHDLAVVRHLCDRVAVMYLGRIVEDGPAPALFAHPRHPYTRALLAAAPVAPPAKRAAHAPLTGELPSPVAPPSGCAFHPRCPLYAAKERPAICRLRTPALEPARPAADLSAHRAACHFAE